MLRITNNWKKFRWSNPNWSIIEVFTFSVRASRRGTIIELAILNIQLQLRLSISSFWRNSGKTIPSVNIVTDDTLKENEYYIISNHPHWFKKERPIL